MLNHPNTKYRSFPPVPLKDRSWPNRVIIDGTCQKIVLNRGYPYQVDTLPW